MVKKIYLNHLKTQMPIKKNKRIIFVLLILLKLKFLLSIVIKIF